MKNVTKLTRVANGEMIGAAKKTHAMKEVQLETNILIYDAES